HDADALAGELGYAPEVDLDQPRTEEEAGPAQGRHGGADGVRVGRRPVEKRLVDDGDDERGEIARETPPGERVRLGKEEGEREEARRNGRLAEDVEPEEGGRAVKVHRRQHEEGPRRA